MAIIRETKIINNQAFVYTHSDIGMKIQRDNILYDNAYDPIDFNREYEETDIPIGEIEEINSEEI